MSRNPAEQPDFEADSQAGDLAQTPSTPRESSASAAQNSFPFEAMNLRVGDRLQAQPPTKVSSERCFVRLIGYVHDLSMLITTPATLNSVRLQLIEGDQLVMRVFSSQNAFGFACDVQRACKLPYSYLHISFPKEVQGTIIRKAARVKTKIIVKVGTQREGTTDQTAVISNLSSNGALLDGRRTMAEVGDSIQLTFRLKLHNIEAQLSLLGLVRAVFDDEKLKQSGTSLAHFGLEFVDILPNDQMLLQSMVYQKMIEQPQSLV
jgi:hypothetical protein